MDPFEEFEFKPLTDGLGFHNRTLNEKTPAKSSPKFDFTLEMMAPDAAENLSQPKATGDLPSIQPALPRKKADVIAETSTARQEPISSASATVDEILKTLGERRKYDFEEKSAAKNLFQQNTAVEIFSPSQFEFSAALLDGMLIVAAYLGAMIVLLMMTKVDLLGNLLNSDGESRLFVSLFGMFAAIAWVYLVSTRMFLGYTPGEWVFDQRMGRPEQLGTAEYSMKIAMRSFLVLATGFILVPLTSMITRQDWLGKMTGVELVRKV